MHASAELTNKPTLHAPQTAYAAKPTRAHLRRGIRVGAGIDQQPHAVRVTLLGGPYQRRLSELRVRVRLCHCAAEISLTHVHAERVHVREKICDQRLKDIKNYGSHGTTTIAEINKIEYTGGKG